MMYRVLADLVVILHLLFILFGLLGGLLVLWKGVLVIVHLPAGIWLSVVSYQGWICPLTPLENQLRNHAGLEGYTGGFIEHYLIPIIYPPGLSSNLQLLLAIVALAINIGIYSYVIYKRMTPS